MATLSLLGIELSIDIGQSIPLNLKNLTVIFTLSATDEAQQARLKVELNGKLDGNWGEASFQYVTVDAPCKILENRVVLQEGRNLRSIGVINLSIDGLSNYISSASAVVQNGAILFEHEANFSALSRVVGHPLSGYLSFNNLSSWKYSLLALNLSTDAMDLLVNNDIPYTQLQDSFGDPRDSNVNQHLRVFGVRLESDSIVLHLAPRTGALFLNADILDSTEELGDCKNDRENGLLFQHVVAEAHLEADLISGANGWAITQWWIAPVSNQWVLAVPALKDEHGNPLVLGVTARVPVVRRVGVADAERSGYLNQAVVLGFRDKEYEVDAKLISIDPIETYDCQRTPLPLKDDRTIEPPYWVRDNRALLNTKKCPREILGWSSNGAIRIGTNPLGCRLKLTPVRPKTDLLFVKASLSFEAQGMELLADLPERTTLKGSSYPTASIRRYRATGIAQSRIELPLCDIGWAFAELVGPKQETNEQPLAETIRSWPTHLNTELIKCFNKPVVGEYEHTEGHRANTPPQSFARLIAAPPFTTGEPGKRLESAFAPKETSLVRSNAPSALRTTSFATESSTGFLFGGARIQGIEQDIKNATESLGEARECLAPHIDRFFAFWAGHGMALDLNDDVWNARRALRKYLVGEPRKLPENPEDWEFEDLLEASVRLDTALEMLGRNPPSVLGFDEYAEFLEDAMPDEVEELRNPAHGNGLLSRLFQYAFAPPSMDVLKRAVAAILSKDPPKVLKQYLEVLQKVVSTELQKAMNERFSGDNRPSGFIAELLQGVSPLILQVEQIWRDHKYRDIEIDDAEIIGLLKELNKRYGPHFTPEVYAAVLADANDSEALLNALRAIGLPLSRLADLSFEPPDYLVISRRTRTAGIVDDIDSLHPIDRAAALWNHRFDFCSLGNGKAWDMFLDNDTTLIVKLGGERSIDSILEEAHKAYVSPDRPDPFGLANGIDTDNPVGSFLKQLAGELREPNWRGVLIINPMIDLGRDQTLSRLCGIPHISARYAAIGGHTPSALQGVDLDVWGHIEQYAQSGDWINDQGDSTHIPEWGTADVGWSLTKFEATIKNTSILSGEIAFQLNIIELFGRREDSSKSINGKSINVSGVLRASDAPANGGARDFTLAASFETPLEIEIKVAFLKKLRLRGVRVGSHNGDTTLDIDAELECTNDDSIMFEFPEKPVRLSDFRIRMPPVSGGLSIPMGVQRALSFDLGAIRFPTTVERQFRIAGLEIKPVGIGMLRGTGKNIIDGLKAETILAIEPTIEDKDKYAYPYLDTRISFGTSPELGGGSQLTLVARAGAAISSPGTSIKSAGLGIASLDARDLELSLFRLMTISANKVKVGVVPLHDPDSGTSQGETAGVVYIDKFNLKLLSWSLFNANDDRKLILAQKTIKGGGRGMLAWYQSEPDSDRFFRLHWLLITRNFDPGKNIKDILLSENSKDILLSENSDDKFKEERDAIESILSGETEQQLNARINTDDPWLFGIRFELGNLFTPCVLVLHDKHYYGIRLGGVVPKLLTGQDELNFAYIPGSEPALDRFRTTFRCAVFDLLAEMRSGDLALEWSPNWDFLIDCGQPWRGPYGYAWERAFSMPVGTYEAKFGFFIERRTSLAPPPTLEKVQGTYVTFSAGAGFYLGYRFELSAGVAWVRAGIGIFGVLIGSVTLKLPEDSKDPLALLKGSLAQLQVVGVLGIYAYGEGGVEVWILSARFRVSAQAFVEVTLNYLPSARSMISWNATLSAQYSASVRVGSGWFSWTFSVSGEVEMKIDGRTAFG